MVVFLIVAEMSKSPAMYLLPNWSTLQLLLKPGTQMMTKLPYLQKKSLDCK